jgi:hypothetical protein
MFAAHLIRLLPGLLALLIVGFALMKSSDRLHPLILWLAVVTAGAPLAIGYVWARSPIEGLLYGMLTYAAACGFAIRLVRHDLPFRYHLPLLILFMASAVTAFVTLPLVVMPSVRDMTVAVDTEEGTPDLKIQQALRDVDSALANIETEHVKLQRGVRDVMEHVKVRSARVRELQDQRDKVMEDLRRLEPLRELTVVQIAALTDQLHKTQVSDNIISFFVGIASSITATLAWKFFGQSR